MNHFQKLPHELQINIFNRIEDKAQLAACRLVCKQWDSIAERAIFSKELVIRGNKSFIAKLYYHLANKPAVALLIKNIYISGFYKHSAMYKKLLPLVMTPSLEQIQGYVSKYTEKLIYQIVLSSPHKFNRIKRIPVRKESNLRRKCLYALRDSLEYMRLAINGCRSNIVQDHLNEFTKLDYLYLNYSNIQGIMELDLTLRRLRNVTKLELRMAFKAENYTPKSSDQMADWLAQNVEKDEAMKSITKVSHSEEHWPNSVDYLTYKYPSLHFLKLDFMECFIDVERILRVTTHIPHLFLRSGSFNNANDLRTLGYMMKSSSNIVEITYGLSDEDGHYCIREACRDDNNQLSKFSVNLPLEADLMYARQLLSAVGSGTSKITKATISFFDQNIPQNVSTLYDFLRLTPNIQDLEFWDPTIEYQELGSGEIDHRVITQLGTIAPNLDRLTLSDSLAFERERNYDVVMPDSNLGFITIYFNSFWADESESESTEEKADDTDGSIYLSIKTELSPGTYYVWRPKDSITMTSKEEFDVHTVPKLSAHIECKSLSSLSLEHARSKITMQFEHGVLLKSY
ncbi:hypothetical protein MBANPS3_007705 [Mucor bainieri]